MALQEVNEVTFGMAEETTIGSVPASATWNRLQVNGNVEYGAQVQTEAREFIDTENQRQKGTVVGLDSSFGFEGDATMDFLRQMVPIFTYSRNANRDLEFRGAAVSSTGYTLANVEDSARAKLMFSANGPTSLFYAKGYANDSNNGLKPMTQAFSSGNILRLGTVAVESSPPSGATLEIAGMRGVAGGFRLTVDAYN